MITKLVIILMSGLIMINCVIKTQAQTYNVAYIPPLDSLHSILELSDSARLNAEITEFQNTYRFNWLTLAPSVGFNVVSKSPMVIISTSGVVSYFSNKQTVKRKVLSISKKNELQHKQNSIKLTIQYNSLKNKLLQFNMILETFNKYEKLYELKQQQYKANEIDAETFMKETISHNERKLALTAQIDNINALMLEIGLLVNANVFKSIDYKRYID